MRRYLHDGVQNGLGRLLRNAGRLPEDNGLSLIPGARLCHAAALVGVSLFCASASAGERSAAPEAVVVRNATAAAVESGPVWVSQATWDPAEEHVVIADPGSGRIYVYDVEGRIQRRIASPGRGDLEFPTPNYAVVAGQRYAIATSSLRWIWFNEALVAQSEWALDWEKGEGPHSRLDVSEFAFSDTHLYAIGNVMAFDGTWGGKGIFAVGLKDRAVQQLIGIGNDRDEVSYYNEPPFNLSVCGDRAWFLQMASTVSIVEARNGGKRLRSFPAEFRKRPPIPALVDGDSVVARHAALRNNPVAEGLFCAGGGTLLLLTRRPGAKAGLQWLVYPVDTSRDILGKPIELPTSAGEIVFVPGRKRWAVLEKGSMKYVGVQPLTRLISFPRPALELMETTAP
jgi:hypothetical protein